MIINQDFIWHIPFKAWFRKAKDVTFDVTVAHRKYYQYGTSLIGIEHGDGAKMDNLPLLIPLLF